MIRYILLEWVLLCANFWVGVIKRDFQIKNIIILNRVGWIGI